MLSGIKTGKRKRKKPSSGSAPPQEITKAPTKIKAPPVPPSSDSNLSAAESLRRELLSGGIEPSRITPLASGATSEMPFDQLQRRGRIQQTDSKQSRSKNGNDAIRLTGLAAPTDRPAYRTEDFRNGSRKGKLKREAMDVAGTTRTEADTTIEDMVAEERSNKMSMDELYARNIARVGSRYKGTELKRASASGADEDEAVDMTMYQTQRLTTVAQQQKERSRQIAQHDKESSITSKFWWWMESPSFQKYMLIALGNHVSLVKAPSNLSLNKGHCYLVPVKHADSYVGCEDDVWDEVQRFQTSLRHMFRKQGKVPIFYETVLPSSKGLWQTRMEVIPVPDRVADDAPMFFKSELTEQAEEWGTHTKLLKTRDKGLRRSVPKKFPYFFVEWEQNAGYAQLIETSDFPKDFGVDTIAGMMQIDPVRFRRKQKQPPDADRQAVLDFVSKWKEFDWTLQLD